MKHVIVGLVLVGLIFAASSSRAVSGADRAIIFDEPIEQTLARTGKMPGSSLTKEMMEKINGEQFEDDTARILVVPVEWSNRQATYSRETLDSMFFSRGVYPGGSIADYYAEVSYGNLIMIGEVLDWYDAGFYNGDYDFEQLFETLDETIDFNDFDYNNDGIADAVVFVRTGLGEEDSHDPNDIWSYAYLYPFGDGPGPYDGVMISRWNTSPEMHPLPDPLDPSSLSGIDTLNTIRVFCHELGHSFGLPDLYDYDDKLLTSSFNTPDNNDHPVYDWDVMGFGGYGLFSWKSANPSHFCGWSKIAMGWIEPVTIGPGDTSIVVPNIETTNENSLFKINITSTGQEYFLLEYRNPNSAGMFDKTSSDFSSWLFPLMAFGPDPLDRGLLILHCDETVSGFWNNNGTPNALNYHVAVEDVGYNPAVPYTSNPEGNVSDSAEWWYPWETRKAALYDPAIPGKDAFTPTSTPNSDSYHDGPTGISVIVDSIVGELLYATISNPNDFDPDGDAILSGVDNCPNLFNPLQEDDDSDAIGNLCDNCPDVFNPDQVDTDGDALGALCDNCPDVFNPGQEDPDNDSVGTLCDNCPDTYNPLQEDSDSNGMGDACQTCCVGVTGNVDMDGADNVDISDLTRLVNHLFVTFEALECPEEANTNGDISGNVDISDLTRLVNHLFVTFEDVADCL